MTAFHRKQIIIGCVTVICALISILLTGDLFNIINSSITNLQYRIRGESEIDSSVSILYFDNNDIESLGGYPLKRSYYALLVKTLKELGVGAIGIDVGFSQPDERYPEYDKLLRNVIEEGTGVVLSGYFQRIDSTAETKSTDDILDSWLFSDIGNDYWLKGKEAHFPFENLRVKTKALGHTNFGQNASIPVFVKYGKGWMPAFGFEMLRAGLKVPKQNVSNEDNEIILDQAVKPIEIPLEKDGSAEINFAGGKKALNIFSAVEVLKKYYASESNGSTLNGVNPWKDKFVLVGIIAEGRSTFIETPFGGDFPSIGMHAMFIHNALHDTFIVRFSSAYIYAVSLVLGIISVLLFSLRKDSVGMVWILIVVFGLGVVSYLIFAEEAFIIPIAQPIFIVVCTGMVLWIYKHQHIRNEVELITREKVRVEEILRQKEDKLTLLEEELVHAREQKGNGNQLNLEAEIERYKEEIRRLREEAGDLQKADAPEILLSKEKKVTEGIVYSGSGPMEKVVTMVKTVADSDATVLLLGESGTGKELVARALHNCSRRREHQFVPVNCGALTETLLESELFGHEKGAFTGAVREHEGRFDLADKGTIFLDEIGDTSEAFQVKLLRVLQDGTFERVGGNHTRRVDVRVVAATNQDLQRAVKEKRFREDLFYRLNVVSIEIPPLCERPDDLPFLIEHFLGLESPEMTCSQSVIDAFNRYKWRGNVRELHSVIKRAVLMARADGRTMLRVKDLPDMLSNRQGSAVDLEEQIISLLREKEFSRSAISETAEMLGGLNRGTVAEYFRGSCFKMFTETGMELDSAVEKITCQQNSNINNKVKRKLREYLSNATELVDRSVPLEEVISRSRPKYKNLPQRYHIYLDQIITAAYEGRLDLQSGY